MLLVSVKHPFFFLAIVFCLVFLMCACSCFFVLFSPLATMKGEGYNRETRSQTTVSGYIAAHAALRHSVTHSEKSAIYPLPHTWVHRCPGLASATVTDMKQEYDPFLPNGPLNSAFLTRLSTTRDFGVVGFKRHGQSFFIVSLMSPSKRVTFVTLKKEEF